MPNIKFSYRYRDSGNYKKHGFVIFDNPINISLEEFEQIIRSKLIDGECFYASEWHLPETFTADIDFRADPTWHEFDCVELTDESPNAPKELPGFILTIAPESFVNF